MRRAVEDLANCWVKAAICETEPSVICGARWHYAAGRLDAAMPHGGGGSVSGKSVALVTGNRGEGQPRGAGGAPVKL